MYIRHLLFIYSSDDGNLDWFHSLESSQGVALCHNSSLKILFLKGPEVRIDLCSPFFVFLKLSVLLLLKEPLDENGQDSAPVKCCWWKQAVDYLVRWDSTNCFPREVFKLKVPCKTNQQTKSIFLPWSRRLFQSINYVN